MTMLNPELTEMLVLQYLREEGLTKNTIDKVWTIKFSELGERGLFAIRDIKQGDLIFVDKALITGPRCSTKYPPMCINCYRSECPLFPCDHGCGLPVCSDECEKSTNHYDNECKYLRQWKVTCGSMWSMDLFQAVIPIRALSLTSSQKNLANVLQCHEGKMHGREMELLSKNISNPITDEDKNFMLRICRVFDTTAFETLRTTNSGVSASLRGLYPLGALQNHCCVPNSRHYFDKDGLMVCRATVPIAKGDEITMTYTDLFWNTHLRRKYLTISKHFECSCKRCADTTEFTSNISALRCANLECFGLIFSDNPLNQKSSWTCRECNNKVSSRQIRSIWSGIMSIINEISFEPPRILLKFIEGELKTLVPETNFFMLDMKFRIVSYFGRTHGHEWRNLSDKELDFKENYCEDLIMTLDKLGCGDCQKKGLILNELYCTRREKLSRNNPENTSDKNFQMIDITGDLAEIAQKAKEILQDDITALDHFKL